MLRKGTVERAFELAQSGAYRTLTQLRSGLVREGCEDVDLHLSGRLIRDQLHAIMTSPEVAAKAAALEAAEQQEPQPVLQAATPPAA